MQLSLAHIGPAPVAPPPSAVQWPDPRSFPHNEGGQRVRKILNEDLDASHDVLLIAGYASLDQVITFLSKRAARGTDQSIRLLFGHEPYPSRRERWHRPGNLSDEMRDYWLDRGVSILLSGEILEAVKLIETGVVQARVGSPSRTLHAKIFFTEAGVILGSSNFTEAGLFGQSEGNVRFETSEEQRIEEARRLAEGFWATGLDFRDDLRRLLDELLKAITWKEALARACAAVLEGAWANQYIPPEDIERLDPPLWPHQRQGLSQALWILENVGSLLVADAAGSGKTRLGAWVLRYAYDHHYRGHIRPPTSLVLVPPSLVPKWEEDLSETGLRIKVDSHGPLSSQTSGQRKGLLAAIENADVLAVDEAHNFLNRSERTRRLITHYADQTILFTATPINRSASDLIALVELLGADNFSDETLDVLARLRRQLRNSSHADEELKQIRKEIERFMVRRTRSELNRIADEQRDAYRPSSGRRIRYPHHQAKYYTCETPAPDIAIAKEIERLADQLTGIARIGHTLELSQIDVISGVTEEQYLKRKVKSAPALAAHVVLDCLRSSRVALYEHIYGTAATKKQYALGEEEIKEPTGNMLQRLGGCAGRLPRWKLSQEAKQLAPDWLLDAGAHRQTCESEAKLYGAIAELVLRMSDARETAKVRHLRKLLDQKGLVVAFDSHLISLVLFECLLKKEDVPVLSFTGRGGARVKRRAQEQLGLKSTTPQLIALCSDALSEGLNLQAASCVVHLDTPTVIRTAEQRAGRVDRMDSRHERVEIWWPQEPQGFAPRRRDLLRERHEMVSDLIGANLELPGDVRIDITELAQEANLDTRKESTDSSDAFGPVNDLIGVNGLISYDIYKRIRTSQVHIHTWVARAPAEEPWAFCVVAGLRRMAPRWVFLGSTSADPITDLGKVAAELRARLASNPPELQGIDAYTGELIKRFVQRLKETERSLLPVRRQRALKLADRVLNRYLQDAWERADPDRQAVVQRVLSALNADGNTPGADLRVFADRWIQLIRPWQHEGVRRRRSSKKIWTLNNLEAPLVASPIESDQLLRLLDALPELPPIGERIVVMIVGVPCE